MSVQPISPTLIIKDPGDTSPYPSNLPSLDLVSLLNALRVYVLKLGDLIVPAGDTQVMFNDGGVLAGSPNFIWIKAASYLQIQDLLAAGFTTFTLRNDLGKNLFFDIAGSTAAAVGIQAAGEAGLISDVNLNIMTDVAGKVIKFAPGTGATEIARFTTTGLGIGTAPSANLEVYGLGPVVKITQNPGFAGNVALTMSPAGASNTATINLSGGSITGATNTGTSLQTNGSLGVGTAPAYMLDVGGDVNIPGGGAPSTTFYRGNGIKLMSNFNATYNIVHATDGANAIVVGTGAAAGDKSLYLQSDTLFFRSIAGVEYGHTDATGCHAAVFQENMETLAPAANAAQALNWNFGGSIVTHNGTNALTFSNVQAAPAMATHAIYVDAFNNVTWPAAVNWGAGGIPSIAGAAWVSLVSRDGGTSVQATVVWS